MWTSLWPWELMTVPLTLGGIQTVQLLTETEADYGTYWQPLQFLDAHWNYTRQWELLVRVLPSSHLFTYMYTINEFQIKIVHSVISCEKILILISIGTVYEIKNYDSHFMYQYALFMCQRQYKWDKCLSIHYKLVSKYEKCISVSHPVLRTLWASVK